MILVRISQTETAESLSGLKNTYTEWYVTTIIVISRSD
jgi:hypothetical protein